MSEQSNEPDAVVNVETQARVVVGFNVDKLNIAGYEVVGLVLGLDAEDGGEEPLLLALPSEDALRIARQIIHVASGTRPLQVQEKIIGLTEAGEENS